MLNKLKEIRNEYVEEYKDLLQDAEYLKIKIEVLTEIIEELEEEQEEEVQPTTL